MDSPGTSNRREFLRGQAAVRALSNLAQAAVGNPPEVDPGPSAQPYLVRMKRWAMACDFELYLNAGQYAEATEIGLQAFDLVEALEAQLTVYRDSSELMQINRIAATEPVVVEPRLFALLSLAQILNQETAGAYDITSGPLSKVWGFHRRAGGIPAEHDLQAALANVGGDRVKLDPQAMTVRFTQPGVELNLGSIGKGYALDRCEELMTAAGVGDFLWHGGRSSVLARGSSTADRLNEGGWIVGVGDPLGGGRRLAEIRLANRALATSGSSVQFFRYQGERYGHILDPRTGWPAEGVFSATVLAPTAAEADALSTAFYVLGVDGAVQFCQRRPEIGALLIYPSPTGSKVLVETAGLKPEDWRLCE